MTVRIQVAGGAVLLWFASLAITTIHAVAQPPNRWKNFTSEDGLPTNTPGQVVVDGNGFLWVMTSHISRFDGYTFRSYKHDSIGNADIMFVDDDGTLWLSKWGNGKIARYDFEMDKFVFYQASTGFGISTLWESISGNKDELWIGARDGLYRFNPHTGLLQEYVNHHKDSVTQAWQNSYLEIVDNGHELLCGTRLGLWRFNKTNLSFSRPPIAKSDSLQLLQSEVARIMKDDGNYWFSVLPKTTSPSNVARDERYRIGSTLVKTDSTFAVTAELETPSGFPIDFARGALWIKKSDTIVRFDLTTKTSTLYMNETANPHSLPASHSIYTRSLNIDRDQNAWAGQGENGLFLLRNSDADFKTYTPGDKPLVTGITFLRIGNGNYLVVSTNGEGIWITPVTSNNPGDLKFEPLNIGGATEDLRFIKKIEKSKDGLWVVTITNRIVKLTMLAREQKIIGNVVKAFRNDPATQNPIIDHRLYTFKEDKAGNLWVGTFLGLTIVTLTSEGNIDNVQRFIDDLEDPNRTIDATVWDICFENQPTLVSSSWLNELNEGQFRRVSEYSGVIRKSMNGTLWIGTSQGLHELKPGQKGYRNTRVDGLRGKWIQAIEEDPMGRLWVSTRGQGLFCYDPRGQTLRQFEMDDGIQGNSFNHAGSVKTPNGLVAFSGGNGVTVFNPLSYQVSHAQPPLYITQLKVNNREAKVAGQPVEDGDFALPGNISALSELVVTYQQSVLNLEFAAIEFYDPQKIKYAYELEGFDQDWVYTDWKNRTATYTNLYAGSYVFKVKATNRDGIWSDQERTLMITVLPPPWRTWWAYAGYLMLVAGMLVGARRLIVQRERYKASMQLEHVQLEKAKEVDRVKTSFFTNISHELRTPLTLIQGPVQEVLEKYPGDKIVQSRLKLVQHNSELLLKLINQLLELSKLEAGTLKVEKSAADLIGFIRAVSNSFESIARQKSIHFNIAVPSTFLAASFDKDKLETIIINLVNNAIKFTPSGGTVMVSCTLKNDSMALEVADTGIGIPGDKQGKIFERFYQVSETHKEVGTGIGLALVKELVELLGGTIELKSAPGEGSSFTVTLPIELLPNEAAIAFDPDLQITNGQSRFEGISNIQYPTPNDEVDSAKPQVLVVEDNNDLRHFIIDCLGDEFDFLQADNGKKGLETATNHVPDLIISDVMMPEMDGISMAGKLKADVRTSHIPLILLTAKSTEDSKLHGLSSGADDYLTKPFNKNELLLKVRNGISRQQKLREKLRADLISTAPKVSVLSADEKFLEKVKACILARLSDEQLSVESLAGEIGLSRVQLYRKVTALTGLSVNELIRKLRLQRAAQLLEQKWGPVSQVAYEVGFSNLSYFSKVFKEEFGVLPSEYESA